MKSCDKQGQLKLSFGMIFSIILIIVFVGFAIYVISIILNLQNSASAVKFANDLQTDVDKVWKSSESRDEVEYFLPSGTEYACFVNLESCRTGELCEKLNFISFNKDDNLVLYPSESGDGGFKIEHVNPSFISQENPFCFKADSSGKVKMTLEKSFSDIDVRITR